ncbi:TonB-dependent receptor [Shewanella mangrovi]|uniref:TonB-dependent receptor n=1 Tax=Shewanella mangrovi TaxID=1515746 RepID=A0A094JGL6_9GAMM|nr:TonB-dependent receptor [Shewanella mangrovi]KFZ39100.1 TonB-dependent receptor [Shewanella mangrovi]
MKKQHKNTNTWMLSSISLAVSMALAAPVMAEDDAAATSSATSNVERIAVVGSRAAPRSVGESPVPVDIIGNEEFTKNGATDMNDLMGKVVPSYNVNAQPISDAATLVRPANMRGLAPDHTLVLVNGKRRHRASVIAFQGGGVSDGAQGPDISVIPAIALKQVEVLRDGAAAQYGSDAIAGVINFQLKDAAEGGEIELRSGQYYQGDGGMGQIAANVGLPLTAAGFANLSFEYKEQDDTNRSVQRDDAQALIDAGNLAVPEPAQVWGTPKTKSDFKFFFNSGLDLDDHNKLYLFGNWARRDVEGGFYYRNPENRSGVYSNDGGATPLIGDLTGDMSGGCEGMSIADAAASDSCYSFTEMFPGGFTPRFGGVVKDASFVVGMKGELSTDWSYDAAFSYGNNDSDFYIKNTVNASLGPDTPNDFDPGRYVETERGVNVDFDYYGIESWNIAMGAEFRRETFEIYNGDQYSFEIGPLASQGFGIGSNGFPGFKPEDAGKWSRDNYAIYVDVEKELTQDLLVTGAVRYEDYDDFGSTTNGKLSAIWTVNEYFSLRGAASTGFRAPTVGQSNVRNVSTSFGPNGLQDQATLPPTNPISVQKGGKPLDPEKSVNLSVGGVLNVDTFFLTLDYFNIKLKDRISQTSALQLTQDDRDALIAQGILDASSYSAVRYFTNDFDTTTQGIDLVISYAPDWFDGSNFSLAYNWTKTEVDDFNPENISDAKVKALEEAIPHHKGSLTWTQEVTANLRSMVRVNYYGAYWENHLDSDGDLPIDVSSAFTVDAELGYDINDDWSVSIGAQNLFDAYPDENPWAGIAGAKYPVTSPYGFNGGFYYGRLNYRF